jgi:hypothetical protein
MFRTSFDAEPQTTLLLPRDAHDPLLQHMQHVTLEITSKRQKYLFYVSRVKITVEKWPGLWIAKALKYRGCVNGSIRVRHQASPCGICGRQNGTSGIFV